MELAEGKTPIENNIPDNIRMEVSSFPSMPQAAVKLRALLKEDDVPMIEIENILRQDPGLSISVLRFMMLDHFSIFFCSRRCELKFTGQELSIELQKIVYPEMYKI